MVLKLTKLSVFLAALVIVMGGVPAPLRAADAQSNSQSNAAPADCVGIASDSNGFGHVTFQLPSDGTVGIIYVQPLWVILQQELHKANLDSLTVKDRSLSASGLLESDPTNYLKNAPYANLINDRCRFNFVGPFIPDIATGIVKPPQYTFQMVKLVGGLIANNPQTTIFVLSFYQTQRADFTKSNNGFGLTPDRIQAFDDQLAQVCQPDGALGRIPQVVCVDIRPFFADMDTSYVLGPTTQDQYKALFYKHTGFQTQVEAYFQQNPDGQIIGDGIHLSLEGRQRLMERMVGKIAVILNPALAATGTATEGATLPDSGSTQTPAQ